MKINCKKRHEEKEFMQQEITQNWKSSKIIAGS